MAAREAALMALRKELEALEATEMPRPLPPVGDPHYQEWRKKFEVYAGRRHDIQMSIREQWGAHALA